MKNIYNMKLLSSRLWLFLKVMVLCGGLMSVALANADPLPAKMPYCQQSFVQKATTQAGFEFKNFDCHVAPQHDFYQHVNGEWMKNTPIPVDKSSIGILEMMANRNDALMKDRLNTLITKSSNIYPENSPQMKVARLYEQGLDLLWIDKITSSLMQEVSKDIFDNDIDDTLGRVLMSTAYILELAPLPFKTSVDANVFKPQENALMIEPGTLLLDDRDVLKGKDARSILIQKAFMTKVQQYLLFGQPKAKDVVQRSKALLAFNQAMSKRMLPQDETDQLKIYKNYTVKDLKVLMPQVAWSNYFLQMGLLSVTDESTIVAKDVNYLKQVLPLMQRTPLQTIKDFQWVAIIDQYAWTLPKSMRDAHFSYEKITTGLDQPPTREQEVLDALSMSGMMQAVGRIYIDSQYSEAANQVAQEMVRDIIAAFRSRLQTRAWLSEDTRQKALQKLDKMVVRVGKSSKWIDYSKLEIDTKPDAVLFANMWRVSSWQKKRQLAKLGQPVDLEEWDYPFHIVNAYYNPSQNSMSFPASILQPPFFSADSDPALNYGGIGTVIGHEMTHGFDAMGSFFSATGELKEWWTKEDRKKFNQLNQKIISQYDHFDALPGVKVNGKLTIGEDLADFGGITAGYAALMTRVKRDGGVDPMVDGLTQSERFYLVAARNWRENIRPEALKMQLSTDPHPPGVARGTLPLINTTAFHETFHTQPKDRMFLPLQKRIEIW